MAEKTKPTPDEAVTFAPEGKLDFGGAKEMKIEAQTPNYSAVCIVLSDLTGLSCFSEHEPDLRLEKILAKGLPQETISFVTISDEGQEVACIRFCKRCRHVYVEYVE